MASTEGGVEIEKVAEETPEKILRATIDPYVGPQPYQGRELAFQLGLEGPQVRAVHRPLHGACQSCFMSCDCSLLEINPLVDHGAGDVHCLDAKINIDGNALYRQTAAGGDDGSQSRKTSAKRQAGESSLNYVALDGSIGCMVNGAGLAMGTMDLVKLQGGNPANFLDVGGGATKEAVAEAFKIILSDDAVKAVLINIFGGIVSCAIIAEGIIGAVEEVGVEVPVVVRFEGNNSEQGRATLASSGLNIIPGESLVDAVEKAWLRREVRREHTRQRKHQGHLSGLHRIPGHPAQRAGARLWHPAGRWRHARQGWRRAPRPADFQHVQEAVDATGATASVIYVPAPFWKDSILEALDAGIELIVCITEGMPTLDMLAVKARLDAPTRAWWARTAPA